MTLSYPLALPFTRFQRTSFYLDRYDTAQESLMTRRIQVVSVGGGTLDRWRGVFQTTPLTRGEARIWGAFFDALRGVEGSFFVEDPDWDGPPAATRNHVQSAGSPTVGAVTDSRTIVLANLAASQVVLRAGDYVGIGNEMKRVVQDVVSDASGAATACFEPALRALPPVGEAVNVVNPSLKARLEEPHGPIEVGRRAEPISFNWLEVL